MAKEISIGVKLVTDLQDFIADFKKAQDTSLALGETIDKKLNSPLKAMQAELYKLKNAQRNSLSMEEYQKIGKEIEHMQGMMDVYKGKIKQTAGPLDNMLSQAKALLPAFSFAAISAGAAYAFNQIKNSTDTLDTQWEIFIGGITSGVNEFWRTLATGNWSNFIDNMKEAIRVGREYADMLDSIEEKSRAQRILEAEAQKKATDLEIKLRNNLLSREEKIKAGQERIKLEEDLGKNRMKVTKDAFDAEMKMTIQQTKLTEDQLKEVMRDIDSLGKEQAKSYLKLIQSRNSLQQAMLMDGSTDAQLERLKKLDNQINNAPASIKNYAAAVKGLGETTDEQLNKLTDAWVNYLTAENSAAENTKKVQTQVNTLLSEGNKELEKEWNMRQKLARIAAEKAAPKLAPNTNLPSITQFSSAAPDSSQLQSMEGYLDRVSEKTKKFTDDLHTLNENQRAVVDSVSDGFNQIGESVINSLGLASDGFEGFLGSMLKSVTKIISMLLANAMANAIAGATSSGLGTGPAAVFTTPAFIAEAIGGVLAAFAAIPKFATGGIIPGNSITGDKVLARVNSGEEILPLSDPRHSRRLGTGQTGNPNISIINEAVFRGEDLYILMKKAESRINRRT